MNWYHRRIRRALFLLAVLGCAWLGGTVLTPPPQATAQSPSVQAGVF